MRECAVGFSWRLDVGWDCVVFGPDVYDVWVTQSVVEGLVLCEPRTSALSCGAGSATGRMISPVCPTGLDDRSVIPCTSPSQ